MGVKAFVIGLSQISSFSLVTPNLSLIDVLETSFRTCHPFAIS